MGATPERHPCTARYICGRARQGRHGGACAGVHDHRRRRVPLRHQSIYVSRRVLSTAYRVSGWKLVTGRSLGENKEKRYGRKAKSNYHPTFRPSLRRKRKCFRINPFRSPVWTESRPKTTRVFKALVKFFPHVFLVYPCLVSHKS